MFRLILAFALAVTVSQAHAEFFGIFQADPTDRAHQRIAQDMARSMIPQRFGWLPALVHLPERRQGRCAAEWKEIDDAVPRLLGQALKPQARRTW